MSNQQTRSSLRLSIQLLAGITTLSLLASCGSEPSPQELSASQPLPPAMSVAEAPAEYPAGQTPSPDSANPTAVTQERQMAQLIDSSDLFAPRFGKIAFEARDGKKLSGRVYRSTTFKERDGPIWFVMHGASRDTDRYIETAAPIAERQGALAVTIHFSKNDFPRSEDYTLAITTSGRANGSALKQNRLKKSHDFLYAEIERVFEAIRFAFNGRQQGYYLFGHSAGAQFTHRLMTFMPNARVLGAVAANAGWYTMPVREDNAANTLPYGLRGSPVTDADIRALLGAPLTVLVGERDTATPANDKLVRGTSEAMDQGSNRRERGENYFAAGSRQAAALGVPFAWKTAIVPRAKHSAAQMVGSAANFLFAPGKTNCVASSAANTVSILLTEILADPPEGQGGDANADGERNPQDDEFVEITNTGSDSICLAGWALGDAKKAERHVFALGTELEPGHALVIFGGGLPTGQFGDAIVQWAAFDGQLSLSNSGDVVTLVDAADKIAAQISWGDCSGQACAREHIDNSLSIGGSIVRTPGGWVPHTTVANTTYSPGVRTDGTNW